MSPRKARYRVSKHIVQSIRDRRRRILFGPYVCPRCKQDNLRVRMDEQKREVMAVCDCGLKHLFKYVSAYEPVDYYSKLVDELSHA